MSETFSDQNLTEALRAVHSLNLSTGYDNEYFANTIKNAANVEPTEEALFDYAVSVMMTEDNLVLKAKGYALNVGFTNLASTVVYSGKKHIYLVPDDLAKEFNITNLGDVNSELQKITIAITQEEQEIHLCLSGKIKSKEDAFYLSLCDDVPIMPCASKDNALDAGYRDDPFNNDHQDEHYASQ